MWLPPVTTSAPAFKIISALWPEIPLVSAEFSPLTTVKSIWFSFLNFGNILTTLGEQESLYDTYYSLAWLTHDATCEDEHYINEYGSLECKSLVKEFNEKHK